jgi:CDP-glycerol glycerophosphotransferase (TagB/SpsB family)
MKYLHYFFLFLGRLVLFPIYFLAGFVPRRPDIIVFGSWGGHRFADNAAAFFIHCQATISDRIRLVWLSRNHEVIRQLRAQGYEAHWLWSPAGMAAALRAYVHVFDCFPKDANFWLSRGAYKVNLWSGVPLKVFERDIDTVDNRYYRLFHGNLAERVVLGIMMPWHIVRPDLIIATSDETAAITARAFAIPAAKVQVTGFPRNDALLDPEIFAARDSQIVPLLFREAVLSDSKVFLYLPTFRDNGVSILDFDWDKLDAHLRRMNAKLFFKTHPMDRSRYQTDYKNIIQLPQGIEVYSLLPGADCLISDYSSVIFDYMLLNRPIIYYTPDLADFESSCRKFNFRPSDVAVGPLCMNFGELLAALDILDSGTPNFARGRQETLMQRLHQYRDAHSSQRVLALINQCFYGGMMHYKAHYSADSTADAQDTYKQFSD